VVILSYAITDKMKKRELLAKNAELEATIVLLRDELNEFRREKSRDNAKGGSSCSMCLHCVNRKKLVQQSSDALGVEAIVERAISMYRDFANGVFTNFSSRQLMQQIVVTSVGGGITLLLKCKYDAAFDVLVEWRDDPVAAMFLGWLVSLGEGFIVRDFNKSKELFRVAFDSVAAIRDRGNSDPRILSMLAEVYLFGRGCFPEDDNAAFEIFSVVSHLSDARGTFWLGRCFRGGYGVDVDEAKAMELIHSAAELGAVSAIEDIRNYYGNNGKEIFFIYCCTSSMLGSSVGSWSAAVCLAYGIGCEKDVEKAIVYYKSGAHAGNRRCCHVLISLLSHDEAAFYSVLYRRLGARHSHPTHLLPYISVAEIRAAVEFPPRVLPE